MQKIFALFLFLTAVLVTNATTVFTEKDSLIYENCISQLRTDAKLPIADLIVKTALFLRETPYVAATLDKNESEQLIVNLTQLDCTTFVENCLAISRTFKSGDYSFENYCNQLKTIRYREGEIEDYSSRLHYSTDWIYDNSLKGILIDKTKALGGTKDAKTINFMSTHTNAYKILKNNIELQEKIDSIEKDLNKRSKYIVLNRSNINKVSKQIKDGDIVFFATNINGLDYSHMGIAYHYKGKLTFIHASSKATKVIVEPQSLSSYCLKSPKCTGISIARVIDL